MPFPNEHAARVVSPSRCGEEFGRQTLSTGVIRLACKDKSGKWITQAYRFKKSSFTAAEACAWLSSHKIKFILFEPASG